MAHTSKKAAAGKASKKALKKAAAKADRPAAKKSAAAEPPARKAPAKKSPAKVSSKKAGKTAAKDAAKLTIKATARKAPAKKSAAKTGASKKAPAERPAGKSIIQNSAAAAKGRERRKGEEGVGGLDLGALPRASVTRYTTLVCLACIFDLFTKQLGLAPRTAYTEVRRYSPTLEELTTQARQRPFFESADKHPRCPFCDASRRWHARLDTYRFEGGRETDAARKKLFASLPKADEQFQVFETKRAAREVFFEWLDALGRRLDFEADDREWMLQATRAFLERREPKSDWSEVFEGLRQLPRSQRLAEGWERERSRLYL
ncbi:MAG TPA: hypothetical protein VGV38_22545, partial [Pyrinomonadaceae bacterium]|nr:hypothetical protein [Pyrinomonadaceae bacterium]